MFTFLSLSLIVISKSGRSVSAPMLLVCFSLLRVKLAVLVAELKLFLEDLDAGIVSLFSKINSEDISSVFLSFD